MNANVKDGVLFSAAKSDADRNNTASACIRNLGIHIPALLDGIDNKTEAAYTGWPDRLYLIDTNGRVAYKSAAGPFGFAPRALEQSLIALLRMDKPAASVQQPRR